MTRPRNAHPVELMEGFLKQAADLQKPFGMSDARRASASRDVSKDRQQYARPNPSTSATRPDMIQAQQALPPPPVT